MAKRKTWKEKLAGGGEPHIEPLDKPFAGAPAGAQVLIVNPRVVDDYFRRQPRGKTGTIAAMRDDLAKAAGADLCCPLSTGMFARIAAEAALEELEAGVPESEIAPFWRVIEPTNKLASKLSCGAAYIACQRRAET